MSNTNGTVPWAPNANSGAQPQNVGQPQFVPQFYQPPQYHPYVYQQRASMHRNGRKRRNQRGGQMEGFAKEVASQRYEENVGTELRVLQEKLKILELKQVMMNQQTYIEASDPTPKSETTADVMLKVLEELKSLKAPQNTAIIEEQKPVPAVETAASQLMAKVLKKVSSLDKKFDEMTEVEPTSTRKPWYRFW